MPTVSHVKVHLCVSCLSVSYTAISHLPYSLCNALFCQSIGKSNIDVQLLYASDEPLRMAVPCTQASSATYSSPAGAYWSPGSWSVATNSWSPGAWVQTPGSPQQYGQASAQAGSPGLTTYSPQQYGRGATQQTTPSPVNQMWTPTPTWTPAPSVSHCPVTCTSVTPS